MHEIICPHCRKAFKIDEAGYADIVKQVRDGEFEQHGPKWAQPAPRGGCLPGLRLPRSVSQAS